MLQTVQIAVPCQMQAFAPPSPRPTYCLSSSATAILSSARLPHCLLQKKQPHRRGTKKNRYSPRNHRNRSSFPFPSYFDDSSSIFSFTPMSASNAISENTLVGNAAPDFEAEAVLNREFVKVKLSDYIGKSYVILFFYPLDFTFVCPTEITAFSDCYSEFEKLETKIIGISTDSVFSHLAWVQVDRKEGGLGDLQYPLVSDITKGISRNYNVLIRDQGVALRGLFIIDKSGIIQYATINNLRFGRSVDETLRILQAIQYVQEHPAQVCPAGWKPGDKTITSNPMFSKGYFSAT